MNELDVVVALRDLTCHDGELVKAGETGTIVAAFTNPPGYFVEFYHEGEGDEWVMATCYPDDIALKA